MVPCSIGDWEVLEHVKVIAFEGHILSLEPVLEDWKPIILVQFVRDESYKTARIIEFKNNKLSASIIFTNWHRSTGLSMNGPHEIGELETGEKISLFISHQYMEEENGIESHSLEFQFMKGGEYDF